jgi:hypothetical protein
MIATNLLLMPGRWSVKGGGWRVEWMVHALHAVHGAWWMVDGGWWMVDSGWCMVHGAWRMENGDWSMIHRSEMMVIPMHGEIIYELWNMDDHGIWMVEYGLWIVDCGICMVEESQCMVTSHVLM